MVGLIDIAPNGPVISMRSSGKRPSRCATPLAETPCTVTDVPRTSTVSTHEIARKLDKLQVIEQDRERERTTRKMRKSQRRDQVIRLRSTEGGTGQGVERQVSVDVPDHGPHGASGR